MNVIVVGRNKHEIEPTIAALGFTLVERDPELIISYGGDGSLMIAEHEYPSVPKAILRDSLVCKKCSALPNEEVLKRLAAGEYDIEEMPKLRAVAKGQVLEGMNDIVVRNEDPRHAMRYKVALNGSPTHHAIIGDGVIVATPFGSTGYYRSITGSSFELGIGVAFNNSTEQFDHMVLREEGVIEIEITRGPAIVYADNQKTSVALMPGEKVHIEQSSSMAKIVIPRI